MKKLFYNIDIKMKKEFNYDKRQRYGIEIY